MKNIIAYLLFMIPILLSGQTGDTGYYNSDSAIVVKENHSDFDSEEIERYIADKKMKFGLDVGAFAGFSSYSGELFGTYVSPKVNYRLTPKFSLTVGGTFVTAYGSPYNFSSNEGSFNNPQANFTRSFLYASGAYKLTDRLIISGTVYKEINAFNQYPNASKTNSNDYQGMIMGVDYKIGENFFIQGQIEISNDPYSRYHNPGSFGGGGFGNSMFDQHPPF